MKVTITKEEIKGIVANTIKQTMGMDVVVEFNAEGDVEFSTSLGLVVTCILSVLLNNQYVYKL